jgi:hypothetical protein
VVYTAIDIHTNIPYLCTSLKTLTTALHYLSLSSFPLDSPTSPSSLAILLILPCARLC